MSTITGDRERTPTDDPGPGTPSEGVPGSESQAADSKPTRGSRNDAARPNRPSPRRVIRHRRLARVPVCPTSIPPEPEKGPSGPGDVQPALEGSGTRVLTLDDLAEDEERVAEHGRRLRVVRAMLRGATAHSALCEAGLEGSRTTRWAQKLYARWKASGAVLDGRITRIPERRVLTTETEGVILLKWNGRRKANARAVWRMVRDHIKALREEAARKGRAIEVVEPS